MPDGACEDSEPCHPATDSGNDQGDGTTIKVCECSVQASNSTMGLTQVGHRFTISSHLASGMAKVLDETEVLPRSTRSDSPLATVKGRESGNPSVNYYNDRRALSFSQGRWDHEGRSGHSWTTSGGKARAPVTFLFRRASEDDPESVRYAIHVERPTSALRRRPDIAEGTYPVSRAPCPPVRNRYVLNVFLNSSRRRPSPGP